LHQAIGTDSFSKKAAGDRRYTHKRILNLRQVWCEDSFAAVKWMWNLRRLFMRETEAAEGHCLLSVIVLNLKCMVRCMG
jgi:hypothetical protein